MFIELFSDGFSQILFQSLIYPDLPGSFWPALSGLNCRAALAPGNWMQ